MKQVEISKPEYAYCDKCHKKIRTVFAFSPEELNYQFPDTELKRQLLLCTKCFKEFQQQGGEF